MLFFVAQVIGLCAAIIALGYQVALDFEAAQVHGRAIRLGTMSLAVYAVYRLYRINPYPFAWFSAAYDQLLPTLTGLLGIILCGMCGVYALSLYTQRLSLVDAFWGLGFVLVAWLSFIQGELMMPRQILVTTLVTLWGLRLSMYIVLRNWDKPEDPRYKELSKEWGDAFYLRSFSQVFMLQGVLLWLISWTLVAINMYGAGWFRLLDFPFVLLWCIGFACEVIADWQLYRFLADKYRAGSVLNWGLWRYSRHPNYFGELLMWWSLWALSFASTVPWWMTVVSPLTLTAIFVFFSIPITERQLATNPQYSEYTRRTPMLIPWLF